MLYEAVEKIKKELKNYKSDSYFHIKGAPVLGRYLIGCCILDEDFASQINLRENIIAPLLDNMHKEDKRVMLLDVDSVNFIRDFFDHVNEAEPEELFTRNSWYVDEESGEHFEFLIGDPIPDEVTSKQYKRSTKKAYKAYVTNSFAEVMSERESEVEVTTPILEKVDPLAAWRL